MRLKKKKREEEAIMFPWRKKQQPPKRMLSYMSIVPADMPSVYWRLCTVGGDADLSQVQ